MIGGLHCTYIQLCHGSCIRSNLVERRHNLIDLFVGRLHKNLKVNRDKYIKTMMSKWPPTCSNEISAHAVCQIACFKEDSRQLGSRSR